MAAFYVDSAATGLNDGSSWANAFTSLGGTTGKAAGSVLYVASTHSETAAGGISWNWSSATAANPILIISADKTSGAPPATLLAGATVSTATGNSSANTLTLTGSIYAYGVTWKYVQSVQLSPGGRQWFDGCAFKLTLDRSSSAQVVTLGSLGTTPEELLLTGCTVDHSTLASWNAATLSRTCHVRASGCTFTAAATTNTTFLSNGSTAGGTPFLFEDCDLSAWTNLAAAGGLIGTFRRCKVKTDPPAISGTPNPGEWLLAESCHSSTISVTPVGMTKLWLNPGSVAADLARYRTGGANDGVQANAYSWAMASNANPSYLGGALESPLITRWVTAGSHTITVYVASYTTLTNAQFWVEVHSGNETASPNETAQGRYQTTRVAPLTTASGLTADGTSTWNGSNVGTVQKVTVSINPTVDGPVTVQCYLALASSVTPIFVDPRLDVT